MPSLSIVSDSTKKKHRMFSNKALLLLFLPLIVEQFLGYLVGLADSIMVSYVGEFAVSGVSLVDFVMALMISVFAALASGGAVIAGQYLGNKKEKEANTAANQLVWFTGVLSVGIMFLIYIMKPFIFRSLFGQISNDVYQAADTYFMIVVASIPFLALYNSGAAIYRIMGNSKLPMKIMLVMNIVNIVGNATLVLGFHMGTAGIAIPTLVSRILAAIIVIILLLNKKSTLHIHRSIHPNWNMDMIKRMLRIGVPYGIENGLFSFGRIIVLSLVATFGTAAIAANAVGGTIVMFQVLPGMAIGLGMTTVISRCVGAKDYEQARYYTKKIIGFIYLSHVLSCVIILVLLPFILNVYGLSAEATSLTMQIVWGHGIVSLIIWPLGNSLPVTFRAAGDAKYAMFISMLSMFFCRIALAYVLGVYFHMGVMGTWIAMFMDWIIKAILFTLRYAGQKWTNYQSI